ncbi:hypothetical protein NLI96_g9477 [Meripilus lineatus]|uniref:Uncharacterized protein n=1 Tax=Meripilus lineatus TaxID=2056292 RepID=A0AAD5UWZ5_9APHY|nr:hypothetical protein NLI96_g9477 [Physisporinus lineatus]
MVDWLGSRLDLSEFSALHLTILVDSDVVKLHHILQNRTHHLTYLYLCLMGTDDNSYESLSLLSHSRLECVELGLFWELQTGYLRHIGSISSRILQLIPPLIVYLTFTFLGNPDLESLAALESSWKIIDNALGDPKFNRLTHFVIDPKFHWSPYRTAFQMTFRNMLPKCYQRRILWVAYVRDSEERGEHRSTSTAHFSLLRLRDTAVNICGGDERDISLTQIRNSYFCE